MSLDRFWDVIDAQLEKLKTAKTVDEVLRICPAVSDLTDANAQGFFGGGGGDGTVEDSLALAGWTHVWREAHYFWCMRSPDGTEYLTYVEGDLYRGDAKS